MDNFLLQAIVNELEPLLANHRLGKTVQLNTTDVALDFRLRDGRWLVASTDPSRLALYLTTRQPKQLSDEPRTDTAFVALIKKYLSGARLTGMEKLGYDRVVSFHFEAENEDGKLSTRQLVVSLTGRGANILLVESNRVLARLRESGEAEENYKEPAPPAEKLDPFQCSAAQLYSLMAKSDGNLATAAHKHFIGFTELYARELAHRASQTDAEQALRQLLADLFEANPVPTLYSSPSLEELSREIGRDEFHLTLSPIELRHLATLPRTSFSTVNEAAEVCFSLLDARRRFLAQKQKLTSQLAAKLKKQRTLAANLERERAGFAKGEQHQRWGELLLANLHQVEKNDAGFAVSDFYDEALPTITIPAADKANAQEAAEHYFKLARKSKTGLATINSRLPEAQKEIADLETQLARLAEITRTDELKPLIENAGSAIPAKQPSKPQSGKKPKEEKISGVRRYRSSDGYEILVGRTDRDNDHLTMRVAKSYDLWFHAADYPGSHVVLRNPQRRDVPQRAILEAAQLAAKFSSARTNAKVAVNFCEKKFVTKPKGFNVGQVRLASFKTVMVEPAEAGERIY